MDADEEGGNCWSFFIDLLRTSLFDDMWGTDYDVAVWTDRRGDSSTMGYPTSHCADPLVQENSREIPQETSTVSSLRKGN